MLRKIIRIDEEKCSGCGICAKACHEGAIGMVGGKAKLLKEDHCDGLGDCLPGCPTGAISFEEREAAAYDENAVKADRKSGERTGSQLAQWPCQIKLAPVNAPFFSNSELLIAADCAAFAYAEIHRDFMSGRITLIGCPKLDGVDYSEKLADILGNNEIQSVTVLRMEVPCCGGLETAVKKALQSSGKNIPFASSVISTDGRVIK